MRRLDVRDVQDIASVVSLCASVGLAVLGLASVGTWGLGGLVVSVAVSVALGFFALYLRD